MPEDPEDSKGALNEKEKERLQEVINEINEDVQMPPYDTNDNKKGYSRQYKEFRKEEEQSQDLTQYETLCYRMAGLFNLSAEKSTKKKLQPSIDLLDWEITPGMVVSATAGVGLFSFMAWFVIFMLN
ncbi:MAG: hypothetical protein BRC30_00180 [Nanohaloarchaea archaeon SW_7_46_7]|nr:MAG: hypothetical protein BRC30_00180 [Nanohaloarchaea archaeon SW_7_46_7]